LGCRETVTRAGDLEGAETLYQLSLAEMRAVDFQLGAALAMVGLAGLAWLRGDPTSARRLYHEGFAVLREINSPRAAAFALIGLGSASLAQRDIASARRELGEALDLAVSMGQWQQLLTVSNTSPARKAIPSGLRGCTGRRSSCALKVASRGRRKRCASPARCWRRQRAALATHT
jgi:hypothetical protein